MPWKVSAALLLLPLGTMAAPPQPGGEAHAAKDLIQTAIERNREILALKQRVVEARALLRQAGVRPPSSVQLNGATGSPLGSPGKEEYSAGYSQPIETGGKRDKRIAVAEKGVILAETEVAERTLRLGTEIKLRYLDAVTDQAKLATLDQLIKTYGESLKLIEARVQQGDAAALDSQLLQVEINRAEAQRRVVAGRIQVALSDLRRLCGIEASAPLLLSPPAPADGNRAYSLAELQRQALEQRPDLRAAKLEEQRGAAEVALAEAQARPDLTLSAQYALRNERMGDLYADHQRSDCARDQSRRIRPIGERTGANPPIGA